MEELQVVTYKEIPVVTTKQIAEMYGASTKKVSNNFNANRKRYTEGKHYFVLEKENKTQFINRHEIKDGSIKAQKLYLWTERGALLLAKSINTDIAWEAYERLVDFYFQKKTGYVEQTQMSVQEQEFERKLLEDTKPKVPVITSWYDRNNNRIERMMRQEKVTRKFVYHMILRRIGEKYDLDAANKLYEETLGYKPKYAMDIVEYFPELGEEADRYLDRMENIIFPR